MCGIAGIVNFDGKKVSEEHLTKMGDAIRHRGPDDHGIFIDDNVGLVHARLSIIDLKTGAQPIFNEDKDIAIVFNGEIYNFLDLREELVADGHRFSSSSDTEVIVHAYEKYGVDCLKHLKGMFAFAIYDKKQGLLFLARDRIGEKPLKYYFDGERFAFASELKSILTLDGVDRTLDGDAISAYFSFLCVPAPLTIFKAIKKLPPASYLVLKDGKATVDRYWDVEYEGGGTKTDDEYVDAIDAGLRSAVRSCMIADVPIGVFLSGGVDSSLITSYLAELSATPVRTFSVKFDGYINELPYAQKVADMYRTDHTVINVSADVERVIEEAIWFYEEPFADSSLVPTYLISREARKYVKVILTGDGGDELFGGYDGYCALPKLSLLYETDGSLLQYPLRLAYKLEGIAGLNMDWLYKSIAARLNDPYYYYYRSREHFNEEEKKKLFRNNGYSSAFDIFRQTLRDDIRPDDRSVFFDLKVYLPEDLLVKMDIASMANSLETRAPFLDYELVETAFNIPLGIKTKRGITKYLLKKLAERRLPQDIIYRKKQGFGAPVDEWLRAGLKDAVRTKLSDRSKKMYEFIDYDYVAGLLDDYYGKDKPYGYRIWTIYIFAVWCDKYLCG